MTAQITKEKSILLKFGGGNNDLQYPKVNDHNQINIYFTVLNIIVREMELYFKGLKDFITNEKPNDNALKLFCDIYNMGILKFTVKVKLF